MVEIKLKKQSWQGNPPPDEDDNKKYINGLLEKGLLETLMNIICGHDLFLRGRKERTQGKKTCESGYLFRSKEAFENGEPWFVCIDAPNSYLWVLTHPIPLNVGSIDIIQKIDSECKRHFSPGGGHKGWHEFEIKTSDDVKIAKKMIGELLNAYNTIDLQNR